MLLFLSWLACAPPTEPDPTLVLPTPGEARWPALGSELSELALDVPQGFGERRIFLDPGHASGDNHGATTAWCETEADVMMEVARDLATWLEETGHFTVRLAREDERGPSYQRRVAQAEAWGADALVSLHLDARGLIRPAYPRGDERCPKAHGESGFSLIYRDRLDGALQAHPDGPGLLDRRERLASALSDRMVQTGMVPYFGWAYVELYEEGEAPGVFRDRRRLYMTRAPSMPSVILETFNGVDPEERWRWSEPSTRRAFSSAVAQALVDAL